MTEEQINTIVELVASEAIAQNYQSGRDGDITLFVSVAATYSFIGKPIGVEPNSPEDVAITKAVNDRLREYNEQKSMGR